MNICSFSGRRKYDRPGSRVLLLAAHALALLKSAQRSVSVLRCARNNRLSALAPILRVPPRYGSAAIESHARPQRQLERLLAVELPMGDAAATEPKSQNLEKEVRMKSQLELGTLMSGQ